MADSRHTRSRTFLVRAIRYQLLFPATRVAAIEHRVDDSLPRSKIKGSARFLFCLPVGLNELLDP